MLRKPYLLMAAVVLVLSACGGSDGGGGGEVTNNQTGTGVSDTANQGSNDSFLARVMAIIGSSSDTAEPVEIDAVPAEASETPEPVPVG